MAEAEHARAEQHAALLNQIESNVLRGEGTAVESGETVLTAVRSPVALRRRAVPDDGAAGCLLDILGGLKTQNCQVCMLTKQYVTLWFIPEFHTSTFCYCSYTENIAHHVTPPTRCRRVTRATRATAWHSLSIRLRPASSYTRSVSITRAWAWERTAT